MQYQNITIQPGTSVNLQIPGTGIWFESGTTSTLNSYIVVKPNMGGGELTLKPGQHFQDNHQNVDQWNISALDSTATITGRIIIGNGDFGDSNVNGTFQLSSAVQVNNLPANPVPIAAGTGVTLPVSLAGTSNVAIPAGTTVTNAAGSPVPVVAGTGVTIPVSIAGNVNTSAGPMTYTNSFATSTTSSTTALAIVTAAANVNGAILNQTLVSGFPTNQVRYAFLAKATAPTSITDGDLLDFVFCTSTTFSNFQNQSPIKVAAGKGIWLIADVATAANMVVGALTTVL